ncbi:hypothetical protein N2152v2_008433 [Parachlorella kessleri]
MPYQEFEHHLPQRDAPYTLADATDLYAVYTVLHIEGKKSQLQWSPQGSFYYFIAVQQLRQDGEPAQQPAAPEGDEDVLQEATTPQATGQVAPLSTAEAVQRQQSSQPGTRTQIVVPLSSACDHLTPELLQRLFSIKGVQAQQLILALVDSSGVVSRTCLYNYIQAPLEGPGTANLELLDD